MSFFGVLLTRLAHAVELESGVGAAGVALEATGDRVPAAATAAAVAIASLHPRRRPCRGLIRDAPFVTAEPADVVVDEPSDATAVEERVTGIEPA
jgi:hypothetical protein